jgi:hypothetical protein
MYRMAHMIALAAFLSMGLGIPMSFSAEPAPIEQKEKKDAVGTKADGDKKDEKKDMGGK